MPILLILVKIGVCCLQQNTLNDVKTGPRSSGSWVKYQVDFSGQYVTEGSKKQVSVKDRSSDGTWHEQVKCRLDHQQ